MADLPNPQSFEQLLSDMLSAYASKQGIDDFNVGSAVTSFFEVVALTTARSSGDVFQILRDFSVDRATGDALKRLAAENKVALITAKPATGAVTVTDTSFTKISSKVYSGATSPNIGSTQIKVSDASLFPSTGSVYIGRGTLNVEGPIPYGSITAVGGYYVLDLNTPTAKFHNIGETVIVAQGGNRTIPAIATVSSPSSGASPDILFTVTTAAVILDGETSVSSVQVAAQTPGADGNVPRGAIKAFSSSPFSGAAVTNDLPFTTGADSESDDQLRVRIKRNLASKGLGTASAVQASVFGATPSDENATISSSSIITTSTGAILYIDDGSGYEAKTSGVGLEAIVDSALGGERFFQLATGGRQAPVAKAFLQSTLSAPFDIIGGDTLAITVGEITYQHVFANSDFISPGGATSFEITASVNADTTIEFEATTSGGGQFVVFRAKEEGNDSIKIATPTTNGRDASALLGLPSNEIQTLRLYKNKIPLSKDGNNASVFTQSQQLWSSSVQTGDTLALSVDGTDLITYSVTDADFLATGLYSSVSPNNSLESWAQVFNAKLTGVTVNVVGTQLEVVSNLGPSNRAQLAIDSSSTLVTKGMFSASIGLSSQGKASDFTLDRNTAQFELAVPLVAGDQLTSGSDETEARVESSQIPGGSVTLSADGHVWILIDAPGEIISTGLASNTLLTVSKPSTNVVRYTSTVSTAFLNVNIGDYVIVWSAEVPASDRLEGRVHAKTNNTFDILVTPGEFAAATTGSGYVYSDGIVFLRSSFVPQKFEVSTGTLTLDDVVEELQDQTASLIFTVHEEQFIIARTRTKDASGRVFIVTADAQGKLLDLPANSSDVSKDSLIAYYDTQSQEAKFPLFIHAGFAAGSAADPINSYITSLTSSISLSGRDPNELIRFLQPYGAIADAQPYNEHIQEKSISGANLTITQNPDLRRVRSVDRYFIANPLDFGPKDTAVVVLDNDTTAKSFEIPFYRRAITNTTMATSSFSFNAYDVDSGSTANFASTFGPTFDFSNFKALMLAKKTIKAIAIPKTALLYRSARWGRSGEKVNVGYVYPSQPNQPINSTISVSSTVDIRIILKSGIAISSNVDASTEWNVTVTPNTPVTGTDMVTYSYSGTGTAPNLTLSGGEYVNIGLSTEFDPANTGVYRVSTQGGFTPNSTSFSVARPTGEAVAEIGRATVVPSAIIFYNKSNTTAAEIQAYCTAQLADYLTATIVNDGGTDGSGVIVLSTWDDTGFTDHSYFLLDGINWISTNDLTGPTQFTFKRALVLPTDVGYAFNNGEEVRLIPTTMDQVRRLTNILAVTGMTTVGTINVVDRGQNIEFATDVLGSDGAIQVIGGTANGYEVPVIDSAVRLDNSIMLVSTDRVSANDIQSDQWFKLQATTAQRKEALLSSNSSVTVLGGNPTTGQATISLAGRALNQRYFGKPRHNIRSQGRTFRVEKQGDLVCVSWNGAGSSPQFLKQSLNFNTAASSGTLNIGLVAGTSEAEVIILTGQGNFNELSIGDLATIANLPSANNNGTFLVTGVSDDGKILRILNPEATNEFSSGTFTLVNDSTAGDTFHIGPFTLVAGTDFVIGGTPTATAANLAAVAGTLSGVSAEAVGNVVTITAQQPNSSLTLSYAGTGTVAIGQIAGDAYDNNTFSASSGVSEGDSVVFSAPFAVLNRGTYRVIRRFNDSIWFENPNMVEEEVTLPANLQNLSFDATTSFKVNASSHSAFLTWNGSGTEPTLGTAQMGDILTFGTDFAAANQGSYMVLRSGAKLPEITQLNMPTGAQITGGQYFTITSTGDVYKYYVWFKVDGAGADPAPVGYTGILVSILSGDTSTLVATKAAAVLNVATGLTATSSGAVVTTITTGSQDTTHAANINVAAPFSVNVSQAGRRTFAEAINPSAVNESSVFVSNVLTAQRPQIQFTEYEGTVAGDQFVVTGSSLGATNAGTYTIIQVIDRENAVILGNMVSASNVSLNGIETSVYVQEGTPYSGYKQVLLVATQPGAPARSYVVFNTNAQSDKIDDSASVQIESLNKMNFPTVIRKGLDSYRYNTGLIAEANRIIYGDARDPETYPGVGAAGADIFVREPLTRRIQVSVDVRIATGVPFTQIAEQVRTSVSSLVNSNDVGASIAISSIVAVVNAIPGVRAMSISSPQYDSTHDIIVLSPSEKARIIDPTTDISVSQIGS